MEEHNYLGIFCITVLCYTVGFVMGHLKGIKDKKTR